MSPTCKNQSSFFSFLSLSLSGRLEIGRTSQTSHVATLCWSWPAADYLAPGTCSPGLPSGRQPASLIRSPAGPVAGICTGHPSFKEVRQKFSLSVLHYFHFLLQRIFPTSEVLRKKSDVCKSSQCSHPKLLIGITERASKNTDAWVLPRNSDLLVWGVTRVSGLHKAPPVILMDSQG